MLVGIPNHPGDPAQLGDFGWRTLRVAAGYQNPAARVCPVDVADQLPNLGIRPRGHSAGVQYRHFARGGITCLVKPGFEQLLLDGSAVRLARTASEIEDLERSHGRISGNIVRLPCSHPADAGLTSLPRTEVLGLHTLPGVVRREVKKGGIKRERRKPAVAESTPDNRLAGPESA